MDSINKPAKKTAVLPLIPLHKDVIVFHYTRMTITSPLSSPHGGDTVTKQHHRATLHQKLAF